MTRSARAFAVCLAAAVAFGGLLALPLLLTLFPGAFARAAHEYDSLVDNCAAALTIPAGGLPPLGIVVLATTAAACLAAGLRLAALLSRTRRRLASLVEVPRPAPLERAASALGLTRRVHVFASAEATAFTAGLLTPRIWISTTAVDRLGAEELDAVLRHERFHLDRRDPLRVMVVRSLAALLVALPLIRFLGVRFEVAKELDADEEALRVCGAGPVATALLSLAPTARGAATAPWSMSGARIARLEGTPLDGLLPGVPAPARWLTSLTLAAALLMASGQAARAHVLHVGPLAAPMASAAEGQRECPLPIDGVLL